MIFEGVCANMRHAAIFFSYWIQVKKNIKLRTLIDRSVEDFANIYRKKTISQCAVSTAVYDCTIKIAEKRAEAKFE